MSQKEFLIYKRDIEQSKVKREDQIAEDNGVPNSKLDLISLEDAISDTVCRGTYSYQVKTKDGKNTRVAIKVIQSPYLREPGF